MSKYLIPTIQFKEVEVKTKKTKSKVPKSPAILQLEKDYNTWYYTTQCKNVPEYARCQYKFSEDSANHLTTAIVAWLKMNGAFGARVNSTGVYDPKTKKFRTSGARKGMADISAVFRGKPLQLEIKHGKDKPREDQLKVQTEYRAAGGVYEFVHNFDEFLTIINQL